MIEKKVEKRRDIIGKKCDLMRGVSEPSNRKVGNLESIETFGIPAGLSKQKWWF